MGIGWKKTTLLNTHWRCCSAFQKKLTPHQWKLALQHPNSDIRKSALFLLGPLSPELAPAVESMLGNGSYQTQETALFALWRSFPEHRTEYLRTMMKGDVLQNPKINILWLTLALVTPGFNMEQRQAYQRELVGFTSAAYGTEIRQAAFEYIAEIGAWDNFALVWLVRGSTHHAWQFKIYCRRLLDTLLEEEGYKNNLIRLSKELKDTDLSYLILKLEEE